MAQPIYQRTHGPATLRHRSSTRQIQKVRTFISADAAVLSQQSLRPLEDKEQLALSNSGRLGATVN
jgi:hypothetical protein